MFSHLHDGSPTAHAPFPRPIRNNPTGKIRRWLTAGIRRWPMTLYNLMTAFAANDLIDAARSGARS